MARGRRVETECAWRGRVEEEERVGECGHRKTVICGREWDTDSYVGRNSHWISDHTKIIVRNRNQTQNQSQFCLKNRSSRLSLPLASCLPDKDPTFFSLFYFFFFPILFIIIYILFLLFCISIEYSTKNKIK